MMNGLPSELASLFALGAIMATIFGVVLRCWAQIKSLFQCLFGVFISTVNVDDEDANRAVIEYMLKNFRISRTGERTYSGRFEHFQVGKYGLVPFEVFGDRTTIFWYGWWPIVYVVAKKKQDDKKQMPWWTKEEIKGIFYFIRNTVNISNIVAKSTVELNESLWQDRENHRRRFFIQRVPNPHASADDLRKGKDVSVRSAWYNQGALQLLAYEREQLGKKAASDEPMNGLIIPELVIPMVEEARLWRENRQWFRSKNIPWKRGWLLYGLPGTGKTALVRGIAEELDIPLFIFSLGEMSNVELQKAWDNMQSHAPCIALFEDFDNVFHGRENVYRKPTITEVVKATADNTQNNTMTTPPGTLSFDCLLNVLDGADKSDGIFTVITTNHVEHIDSALGIPRKKADGTVEMVSSRPGRIDKAMELGYMVPEDKIKLAKRMLGDAPNELEKIIQFVEEHPEIQETPAQFQERCTQIAIANFWKKANKCKQKSPKIHHCEQMLV